VTGGVATGRRGTGSGRGAGARGQCVDTETPAPTRPAPTVTPTGRLDHGVSCAATTRKRVKVTTDIETPVPVRFATVGDRRHFNSTLVHRTAAGGTRVGRFGRRVELSANDRGAGPVRGHVQGVPSAVPGRCSDRTGRRRRVGASTMLTPVAVVHRPRVVVPVRCDHYPRYRVPQPRGAGCRSVPRPFVGRPTVTPLRDLTPADPCPRQCANCWGTRWRVVIVRRVAWWECVQCRVRPAELSAAHRALGGDAGR
jgi:hypothetical protein